MADKPEPKYPNAEALAQKMMWEGGPAEMIASYGLAADDLPDDLPGDVRLALTGLIDSAQKHLPTVEQWMGQFDE